MAIDTLICESLGKFKAIATCANGHTGHHYLVDKGYWYERCVECQKQNFAKNYKANKDVWNATRKKKYWADAARRKELNNKTREYHRATHYHIRSKYGLTKEMYDEMVAAQNGVCAICLVQPDKLFVDHNHNTGAVRGLLCHSCNVSIGHLKEDLSVLKSAIRYLEAARGH